MDNNEQNQGMMPENLPSSQQNLPSSPQGFSGYGSPAAGPMGYPPGDVRYATARPTSVTVFGVLNCVFGGLGVLCTPFSMIFIMIPNQSMEIAAPYKIFLLISSIAGICFSGWLLSLGIGLLKFKGWARRGSVIYGFIAIVWGIAGTILSVLAISMGWMGPAQGGSPEAMGGIVGGFCGGIIGLIYPVLLLIFMSSAKVKQAFEMLENPKY